MQSLENEVALEKSLQNKMVRVGINAEEVKNLLKIALSETGDPLLKLKMARIALQIIPGVDSDALEGMFEIKIVERVDARPEREDCFQYLFGYETDDKEAQRTFDEIVTTYAVTGEPVPGSFALYFDEDMNQTHIGKVTERKTVISKWGADGHVYEHLPFLVPYSYGPHVIYFSEPSASANEI